MVHPLAEDQDLVLWLLLMLRAVAGHWIPGLFLYNRGFLAMMIIFILLGCSKSLVKTFRC